MYKLGIVIPTYNESENITSLLEILKVELITNNIKTKILIVDDSSPDGTANLVKKFLIEENNSEFEVDIYSRPSKSGLSTAYIEGLNLLKPDCKLLLEMDADHSHRPTYIKDMIKKIDEGADFVIGSRYIKGGGVEDWGLHRKILSMGASFYCWIILGVKISDYTGGFNMYKSIVFDKVDLRSISAKGYLFQIILKYNTYRAGFKFAEVPIVFPDRRLGKSKFSNGIIWEAFFGVLKLKYKEITK